MSRITDVIVSADMQAEAMAPLTHRDDARGWSGAFTLVTDGAARAYWNRDGKNPAAAVWVGTFDHLDRPALLADLEALPWTCPHTVQVLIRVEDDDCFGLWMMIDGKLREVALPRTTRDAESGVLARIDCPGDDL
ncbi:hypothetical protein [Yinghuangia soli]|uniref:Uncharacterized protein n=1 Tax=Yinghuangia soli TaxID=2908204 RepID=A0AA41U3R3_9ACTN|nr:hypothetical protein [Yinghuangia soli]MCF2532095.1 hypothetical protein [Yinghuangia soli]